MATASTMTIFCLRCGHENAGENRFCGMCGAVLLRPRSMGSQSGARGPQAEPIPPQSVREPQEGFSAQPSQAGYSVPPSASTSPPAPQPQIPVPPRPREWPKSQVGRESPISGPSFLGLDSTTDRDPDYLLDEVPPTSHWRLYLALALLILAGVLFWIQWGRGQFDTSYLGSLIHRPQSAPASPSGEGTGASENTPDSSATSANDQNSSASPSASSQRSSGESSSAVNPPKATAPAASQPPRDTPEQPSAGASEQGANAGAPAAAGGATGSANPAAADTAPVATTPATKSSDSSARISTRQRAASAAAASTAAAPKNPDSEALVDTAEKYLDGQGVPQSCDRALTYLRQAVDGSVRAKSKLGGLYATGHCVALDRPTAYRWFALALHEQPTNPYIEHNLQMLWNQMSPDEKSRVVRVIQ